MRDLLFTCLCLIYISVHAQSYQNHRGTILKWDIARLLNPYNSTIQVGAEFGLSKSVTIHSDAGMNSNLFAKKTFFNRGIFISHNQLRKYMRRGNFYGIDLFYIHAKDFSTSQCFIDKDTRIGADYDSVTFIKNAPGAAMIFGNQAVIGRFTLDIFIGAGMRWVNNRLIYLRQTNTGIECEDRKWEFHNEKYIGNFSAIHFSFGAKLGYILKGKKKN